MSHLDTASTQGEESLDGLSRSPFPRQVVSRSKKMPVLKKKQIRKLDKQLFKDILHLEERVASAGEALDLATLQEIVRLYGECVSYYDHKGELVSFYFMEKIQQTLISMRSLQTLAASCTGKKSANDSNKTSTLQTQNSAQSLNVQNATKAAGVTV